MKKNNAFKAITQIISAILALSLCIALVSCGDDTEQEPKETKYDIAMEIVIKGHEGFYILEADAKEMEITIPYDGEKHKVVMTGYQLPDHPEQGDKWFMPRTSGQYSFYQALYRVESENWIRLDDNYLKEEGRYVLTIDTLNTEMWNHQYRKIYINVVGEDDYE